MKKCIIITENDKKLPFVLPNTECKIYNQHQFLKESDECNIDVSYPIYIDTDTIGFSVLQELDKYKHINMDINFYKSSLIKYLPK